MGWPSLEVWASNFYHVFFRSQGSCFNFSGIFGLLHNSGKIHELRPRFLIPAPTSSSSPTSRICFSVVRCPFEVNPIPIVLFWSPETHIKNKEQTDYVWLVNWFFLPDRTILPEILGSFMFLMFINFLTHFDRFLLIGFFREYVQNIPRNKSGKFGAIWSCIELIGYFRVLFQLKHLFPASRVSAAFTVSSIWAQWKHFQA